MFRSQNEFTCSSNSHSLADCCRAPPSHHQHLSLSLVILRSVSADAAAQAPASSRPLLKATDSLGQATARGWQRVHLLGALLLEPVQARAPN